MSCRPDTLTGWFLEDTRRLIAALREIFPQLSSEDQQELFRTIQALKVEAAEREADKVSDPDIRMFAQGFATLDRQTAGMSPRPKQLTVLEAPAVCEETDETLRGPGASLDLEPETTANEPADTHEPDKIIAPVPPSINEP